MLSQTLEAVDHQPYLGVTLSKSLNWKEHTLQVKNKANSSLGFIKGTFIHALRELRSVGERKPRPEYQPGSSKMGKIETFLSSDDQ